MLTMEQIIQNNREYEREDTLYEMDHRFYRKGVNGNTIEKDGDEFFGGYNELEEAMGDFQHLCQIHKNELVVISLKQAKTIDRGMIQYEVLKEFDSRIRNDIVRSLGYIFDNAFEKGRENAMYHLEQLPMDLNSDYDETVHEYIDKLYDCIRHGDEDTYEDLKSELIDHYFNYQFNYDF